MVRQREWTELVLAGSASDGRADWTVQHDEHLRSRVAALVSNGLPAAVIAERLGLSSEAVSRLANEVRCSTSVRPDGGPAIA